VQIQNFLDAQQTPHLLGTDFYLLAGRFSFLASSSLASLNEFKSNLISDLFYIRMPRGSRPSKETYFIYSRTSEFSLRLLNILCIRPIAKILSRKTFFLYSFACSLSVAFTTLSYKVGSSKSFSSSAVQFRRILYNMLVIFSAKNGIDQLIRFKLSGKRYGCSAS
jgi:hypothetical protein